ncbi:hypothetical protein GIB67_035070 [Kingdonia uniflora]|uniref:Uncharacterized protein n=1 Tax=Kingdonia uniflora TaxID=39325 RepID=A0A7J7L1L2_9MAGN|nr:hypothetical protein GIB67_035070 [Kingdonia uniflora]
MGEENGNVVFVQLEKLSNSWERDKVGLVFEKLWETRRIGITSEQQRAHLQSLLNLPSLQQLLPVLSCLRSLIRKCVHENLTGDDMLKLFPPNLSPDLQGVLVVLLQKYQSRCKEEASTQQPSLQRAKISCQFKVSMPPPCTTSSAPAPEISLSMWPAQDDHTAHFHHSDVGNGAPRVADTNFTRMNPVSLQGGAGPPNNLVYTFNTQYVKGKENTVADGLSRRKEVLLTLRDSVVGFETLHELYLRDEFFGPLFSDCLAHEGLSDRNARGKNSTHLDYWDASRLTYKGILPHLKSMTWTMKNRNLSPANRVAVISLKVS